MAQYLVWILLAGCVGLHFWMMRKMRHGGHCEHDSGHGSGDTYTCPMHPEVKQDKPGSCPECGMNLTR